MRYFVDTEFIDNGYGPIDLISIGVVAEDGREYYAVNADCPLERASPWVQEHVLPALDPAEARPHQQIRAELLAFVGAASAPEFWGYCTAYDWVVFCQLFGTVQDLPSGWPRYFRDLRQWADFLGVGQLPVQDVGQHHALWDARWNRQAWEYLDALARSR